jgi:hypothetical protein
LAEAGFDVVTNPWLKPGTTDQKLSFDTVNHESRFATANENVKFSNREPATRDRLEDLIKTKRPLFS